MPKADIGVIGLAVMGENLILNMESKGFTVACYNRTTSKVDAFVEGRATGKNIVGCHSPEEYEITKVARKALGRYADMEDLIRLGAYKAGSDPETDQAITFFRAASPFLSQSRGDKTSAAEGFADTYRMILESGIDDPLRSFFEERARAEATPAQ